MPDLVPAADELEDDSPRISILLRYIIIFSGSQHNTQRLATYIKAHDPTGIIPARGGGVAVSYRTPGLGDYSGGDVTSRFRSYDRVCRPDGPHRANPTREI